MPENRKLFRHILINNLKTQGAQTGKTNNQTNNLRINVDYDRFTLTLFEKEGPEYNHRLKFKKFNKNRCLGSLSLV